MKSSTKWILAAIGIGLLCTLVLWWMRDREQDLVNDLAGSAGAASHTEAATGAANQSADNQPTAKEEAADSVPTPNMNGAEKLSLAVANKNVSIEFWGKIVDQDGAPLQGAVVVSKVRTWYAALPLKAAARLVTVEAESDRDGLFKIDGQEGDTLAIESIEKPGYELEPLAKRAFGFNTSEQYRSRPESPAIFRLWEAAIDTELITVERRFTLIPDGRPFTIDLLAGEIHESSPAEGDLRVTVVRPTDSVFGQKYEWSCSIDVLNGGMVRETDPHASMFTAPDDGYESAYVHKVLADDELWSDTTGDLRFYLRLRGGEVYGRMAVRLSAYYSQDIPSRIHVSYTLNPSGSRLLR